MQHQEQGCSSPCIVSILRTKGLTTLALVSSLMDGCQSDVTLIPVIRTLRAETDWLTSKLGITKEGEVLQVMSLVYRAISCVGVRCLTGLC